LLPVQAGTSIPEKNQNANGKTPTPIDHPVFKKQRPNPFRPRQPLVSGTAHSTHPKNHVNIQTITPLQTCPPSIPLLNTINKTSLAALQTPPGRTQKPRKKTPPANSHATSEHNLLTPLNTPPLHTTNKNSLAGRHDFI
jgi:hypothetical protein